MKSLKIIANGASDAGRERTTNEDKIGLFPEMNLFVVADGMGGHAAGGVASRISVNVLSEYFSSGKGLDLTSIERLSSAIKDANLEVIRKGEAEEKYHGMGTTIVALLIDGKMAIIGHVGDSRGYLIREGNIKQLTYDHSLVNQYVRDGLITQEDARGHPLKHILTNAVGISEDLAVDLQEIRVEHGDIFLLCSDGLTNMLEDGDILSTVQASGENPSIICNRLIDLANNMGGEDNISIVIVKCTEG